MSPPPPAAKMIAARSNRLACALMMAQLACCLVTGAEPAGEATAPAHQNRTLAKEMEPRNLSKPGATTADSIEMLLEEISQLKLELLPADSLKTAARGNRRPGPTARVAKHSHQATAAARKQIKERGLSPEATEEALQWALRNASPVVEASASASAISGLAGSSTPAPIVEFRLPAKWRQEVRREPLVGPTTTTTPPPPTKPAGKSSERQSVCDKSLAVGTLGYRMLCRHQMAPKPSSAAAAAAAAAANELGGLLLDLSPSLAASLTLASAAADEPPALATNEPSEGPAPGRSPQLAHGGGASEELASLRSLLDKLIRGGNFRSLSAGGIDAGAP